MSTDIIGRKSNDDGHIIDIYSNTSLDNDEINISISIIVCVC